MSRPYFHFFGSGWRTHDSGGPPPRLIGRQFPRDRAPIDEATWYRATLADRLDVNPKEGIS
jgi:hypothetical protein